MKKQALFIIITLIIIIATGCIEIVDEEVDEETDYYIYEGYVMDFITQKKIPYAKIKIYDKSVTANKDGYFSFTNEFDGKKWIECTADGYNSLESKSVQNSKINKVYLIKPYSLYGQTDYDDVENLEILLEGTTFEGEDYSKLTYFNQEGYFYFLDVPFHTRLSLYIYRKGEDKNSHLFHETTLPVYISRYGAQYIYINKYNIR